MHPECSSEITIVCQDNQLLKLSRIPEDNDYFEACFRHPCFIENRLRVIQKPHWRMQAAEKVMRILQKEEEQEGPVRINCGHELLEILDIADELLMQSWCRTVVAAVVGCDGYPRLDGDDGEGCDELVHISLDLPYASNIDDSENTLSKDEGCYEEQLEWLERAISGNCKRRSSLLSKSVFVRILQRPGFQYFMIDRQEVNMYTCFGSASFKLPKHLVDTTLALVTLLWLLLRADWCFSFSVELPTVFQTTLLTVLSFAWMSVFLLWREVQLLHTKTSPSAMAATAPPPLMMPAAEFLY